MTWEEYKALRRVCSEAMDTYGVSAPETCALYHALAIVDEWNGCAHRARYNEELEKQGQVMPLPY